MIPCKNRGHAPDVPLPNKFLSREIVIPKSMDARNMLSAQNVPSVIAGTY